MEQPGFFEIWLKRVDKFYAEMQTIFDEAGFPARVQGIGCTFGIYVGAREPVRTYHDIADKTDPGLRKTYFNKCIEKGLYFHTDFTVSAMHDEALLARSLEIMRTCALETMTESTD